MLKYPASFLIFCLCACGGKEAHLVSLSPDGKTHIDIKGVKSNTLEPFDVIVNVTSGELEEEVELEIFSKSLDSSNVHFDWRDASVCLVTFAQQDDIKRKILTVTLENKIGIKEIGKQD